MTKLSFDAIKVKNDIVQWIRDWFEINGKGCKGVLGISGGKDSSVVAALLVEALGKENVVGVLMPKGEQFDIDVSKALVEHLGIQSYTVNINDAYNGLMNELQKSGVPINTQATTNLPPRLRMATVYAVSQSVNGRVANTCNLSEDWVGYSTRYGDSVGIFHPFQSSPFRRLRLSVEHLIYLKCLLKRCPLTVFAAKPMKIILASLMQLSTDTSVKEFVKMKK